MKKIIFIIATLFLVATGYSQVIYNDDWPSTGTGGIQLRYGLTGAKWNKTALKYYIYNTSLI